MKLFNHNFNFRDSRHRRVLLKSMRITTTKGTNLMKAFIIRGITKFRLGVGILKVPGRGLEISKLRQTLANLTF